MITPLTEVDLTVRPLNLAPHNTFVKCSPAAKFKYAVNILYYVIAIAQDVIIITI